ncbi:TIGR04255 family protein [Microbacterium sp. CFH 90308]|uniref:TIGR04255 family protein n=1 Tax=Microbacterium salsuginis TaxID=2722803 RepID=A0ABX1KCW4_9MICO|nr:TIGR04255 family protein [Microbacterium sp. CFH 90308]
MTGDDVQARSLVNPPVIEAVAGIEFRPRGLGLVELVRETDAWRDRYPTVSTQGALPPTRPYGQPGAEFEMQLLGGPPPLRVWSESLESDWLLQTQDDRLLLNWRRVADGARYPGYDEAIRPEITRVLDLVASRSEPSLHPLVAEFSYVNKVATELPGLHHAYATFRKPERPIPGEVVGERYEIVTQREVGSGVAQLTASIQPSEISGQTVLTLSTKVFATRQSSLSEAIVMIDDAHATSKEAFFAIVSDNTASQWGDAG